MVGTEEDLPEPPHEAYTDEYKKEIDDSWLAEAEEPDQVAAIVQWFNARFWDPANDTPYMSSEGGYIWVNGGPYDASEQIEGRFSGVASEEAIESAIEHVQSDGIYDWAPTQLTYYDEDLDVFVDERNAPTQRLDDRLRGLVEVLALQGDREAMQAVRNLTYAGVIAALETFLWETMAYWVKNERKTVTNLITKLPVFRDRPMKLGDIYEMTAKLEAEVRAYMQRMVWHRWDDVARIVETGLDLEIPSLRAFKEPTQKRHDIVHRSGHDMEGNPIEVSDDEVRALVGHVMDFANELDGLIAENHQPDSERFQGAES